jgi:hypothetical protein
MSPHAHRLKELRTVPVPTSQAGKKTPDFQVIRYSCQENLASLVGQN